MPRKVLIVDDNAINRQMLIGTLNKEYDILEASNGREALTLMHRNFKMLSAVLLDIVMPEVDGFEVLRQVRDNPMLSQIPIIIVTGAEDENSKVTALSLGANDFILKPFNPDIVRHCLHNNIALREAASILNAIQKDKLTGLYNREAFFEKVSATIKDREPGHYILSCFDIDNFKLINDQYGAAEGDRILKEIGATLQAHMARIGGLAGRISADNFATLYPVTGSDTDIIQLIQDRKLVFLDKQSIVYSVGRYLITDTSLPASAIYDRAYIAKQSVKGRYDKHIAYFDETMLKKLVQDQQMIGEMETALSENKFETWFQPQYNNITGALIGAEAMVRWRHAEKGTVLPGEFIPLFEQNGFVYELDKYVWRSVCKYLRKWLDNGFDPLPVSVNISRYDIFRHDFVNILTGLVAEYNIPPELLRLEITESAFAKSTKLIVDIVKQLIALGFTIEIDDFGSGYSSLNTLKSVPAQVVKLDMRFLEDEDGSQRGGNILEAVVRMTKWLGISVIAEGVETREQSDFLKSIGCAYVQGYLFARPMPAEDYEALFSNTCKEERLLSIETVENLDNNAFWDPQSMDTLIFNSYVGAACIFEFTRNKIEILRSTDKYARMLCGPDATVDTVLSIDFCEHITKDTRDEMILELEKSARTNAEVIVEHMFHDLPGCPREIFFRSTMRVIAYTTDRYLVYCIGENITAQRHAEQSEAKVVKQLQAIMDNVNCGITAVTLNDGNVNYLLANDRYYELIGYTRQEYDSEVGSRALSITIHSDDRKRVSNIIERTRATGMPTSMEYRAVRRDGSAIWLRSFISMTSFEGVEHPVQLCTYADITAEKNAAQELLDNMPAGAALYEYDGERLSAVHRNKRYWEMVHRSAADFSELSVLDAVHPDDRPVIMQEIDCAIRQQRDAVCDIRILYGSTGYCHYHVIGRLAKRPDGKYSIYASYTPISNDALSIQEMLPIVLTAVMSSSSQDIAFVKDKNLRYICCSRSFAHMVGLESEKDIVGKTDFDIFDGDYAKRVSANDIALMDSGLSIVDRIERIARADGKERYISASKYLLYDSTGGTVGIYVTGHDITEAREAESQQSFLINSIPGGVAIYEGEWSTLDSIRLTYFSDGFCRLFGYTRDEYEKLCAKTPTSLITDEYIPGLIEQINALVSSGAGIDYIYRAHVKGGEYRWIHLIAVPGERRGATLSVNAVLFDVTERQDALEKLRVSEEENRLAIKHSRNVVCRYDVATMTLRLSPSVNAIFEAGSMLEDVPYGQVRSGRISPETAKAYTEFYESIIRGENNCELVYQRKSQKGWRWIEAHSSTIYSSDGKPVSAVISFTDATERYEKDAAYKKWLQSLRNKEPAAYSLYRCNVSKKTVFDTAEGELLSIAFQPDTFDFDGRTAEYVASRVLEEDAERFCAFLSVDALLEKYYRGERIITLEYREKAPVTGYRWLRLTVDLVEYPHSSDVEAYLLFENIDEAKRAELLTIERAEKDPLTGVYNRTTFAEKVNELIKASSPQAQHALLMLDIDGFKLVNDAFGHNAGDQTLIDIANLIRTALRRDDLVGRLGGDEFVIFLNDIPGERIASTKAKQICELTRMAFNADVQISGSVGIALCPHDGASFETLYKKADETLYHVKDTGRDNYAFYHEDMNDSQPTSESAPVEHTSNQKKDKKRRMLIVDDSRIDYELLANMFKNDFIIEKARDGNSALIRLCHYGSAISVVLLDLMMPGMDGFAVLEKMQQNAEMRSIPVIVVSGDDDRETSLRAIRCGATDYVTKPVDPDVLHIRVQSAISKAENERLRAKNSILEMQNSETKRYKTVLDRIGFVVIEMDWLKGTFIYGASAPEHLSGRYDGRSLWHIFLADLVTDAQTVKEMQQLVQDVADNRNRSEASMAVMLKASDGRQRWFRMNTYKLTNDYGLTDKMILTYHDIDSENDN